MIVSDNNYYWQQPVIERHTKGQILPALPEEILSAVLNLLVRFYGPCLKIEKITKKSLFIWPFLLFCQTLKIRKIHLYPKNYELEFKLVCCIRMKYKNFPRKSENRSNYTRESGGYLLF